MQEALERAEEAGMDLVQISNADPIVCKIMDYGKFQYQKSKKENEDAGLVKLSGKY